MNKYRILVLAGAVLALSQAVNAQVLLTDNFNTENAGSGQLNYSGFANWNIANASPQGGTLDLIGNGFFDFYPGNGLYVDLLGSGNGTPGLLQSKTTFNFLAGETYTLSFDLGGSTRGTDNHVDVKIGSLFTATFDLPSNQALGLATVSFSFVSDQSGNVSFQNEESGNLGAILDNVSLVGTPIPTTSAPDGGNTALLGGIALLALVGMARVKKSAAVAN